MNPVTIKATLPAKPAPVAMLAGPLVALVAAVGCANPATGIASNGGDLRVRYATGTGTYVSNDVVGTYVHRDANGNEIGSTDRIEARAHSYQWNNWGYYQGRDEIDEHDFYRLAGDRQASDEIAQFRASAIRRIQISAPITIVAAAVFFVLSSAGKSQDHVSSAQYAGWAASGVAAAVGGYCWYWGSTDLKTKHHLPAERADQNADIIEQCSEGRCEKQRGGRGAAASSQR